MTLFEAKFKFFKRKSKSLTISWRRLKMNSFMSSTYIILKENVNQFKPKKYGLVISKAPQFGII
ncbi:uncharacterized protein SPAPADRAFT_58805, partial [Spathaspora passalidarum NRRL Y-27907]